MSTSEGKSPSNKMASGEVEDVCFDEPNNLDGFLIRDDSEEVAVYPSKELCGDSSPFHFNTIVDYTWEVQYHLGHLIATHLSQQFIAYVVKVGTAGAIRVIDMESKERVLMKGEKGLIKDVDFLHKLDDIIIGFIDEYGTFYINKIIKELKSGKLTAHPVIKVTLDGSPVRSEHRRFIWCRYVPDELKEVASPKDCAYHYAVLQNDIIYAGNLVQLVQHQQEGPHHMNEIKDDFLIIDMHSSVVTDASFAPDGTALATCSKDGTVKFFQIYFQEKAPARCLYSWAPHDGRPIDSIFFLDNYSLFKSKDSSVDSQYWKYMLTAADNCSEIKLFTCRSWKCLQTLRFRGSKNSQWKLELDVTSRYLMATDIHTRAVYLLHIECDDSTARVAWIHEFSMPWTTIGFNICSAVTLKYVDAVAKGFGPAIVGDQSTYRKDDMLHLVEMNVVQPRSMQQGSVALRAPKTYPRSRSNSARRISFNQSIDMREFAEGEDRRTSKENVTESIDKFPISVESEDLTPTLSASTSTTLPTHSFLQNSLPINVPAVQEVPPATAAVMSEQLSSLIGLIPGGQVDKDRDRTQKARGHENAASPAMQQPQPSAPIESVEPELRINGSGSKMSASSSPSREVEEILSPKSTKSFVGRGSGGRLEETIVMNASITLDEIANGNATFPITEQDIKKLSELKGYGHGNQKSFMDHGPQVLEGIKSLTALVCAQANEIKELRNEVGRLKVMYTDKGTQDKVVVNQLLESHSKQTQNQLCRIEDTLLMMHKERSQTALPPNIAEMMAASIGGVVRRDLEVMIPEAVMRVLDPTRLNISSQIDRLTTVVEAKLAQDISQILQKDRIWQTLTNNFQAITKTVFDSTFNDIFLNSVFPRCQTAVQEMLSQVNETFRTGTRQYLTGLENVLDNETRKEDIQQFISQQLSTLQDTLSSALQVEIESQMLRVLGGVQGSVVRLEDTIVRHLRNNQP